GGAPTGAWPPSKAGRWNCAPCSPPNWACRRKPPPPPPLPTPRRPRRKGADHPVTKPNTSKRPIRVGLISLGCAKNLVDAEIMLGSLLKDGVEITNDATSADVVIVNTCSFIDAAQESVDAILESVRVREAHNRGQGLVVSGCLPQRFRGELPRLLPEVDAFMGIDQVGQVSEIVRQAVQRRRQRLESPKSKVQSTKSGVAHASEIRERL